MQKRVIEINLFEIIIQLRHIVHLFIIWEFIQLWLMQYIVATLDVTSFLNEGKRLQEEKRVEVERKQHNYAILYKTIAGFMEELKTRFHALEESV